MRGILIGAVLAFCAGNAVAAAPDFGRLGICSALANVPAKAKRAKDCFTVSRTTCDFVTATEPNINYTVENGKIVSKAFSLGGNRIGPYGITAADNPASAGAKIRKATGLKFPIFDAEMRYLQSSDIRCGRGVYTISVFFDGSMKAAKIVSSTLPAF
jgi:hypothetical protein